MLLLPVLCALCAVSAAVRDDPIVVLETRSGERSSRALAELDAVGPAALGATFVRFAGLSALPDAGGEPGRAQVVLVGGDRLSARVVGGEADTLHVELVGPVRVPLSIDRLASLVVPDRVPEGADVRLEPAEEGDRLFRRVGGRLDRIEGAVESFGAEGVRFDADIGARTYPWEEVAALFVEAFENPDPLPVEEGEPVVLDLVDASRLRGVCRRLSPAGVQLVLMGGAEVLVPLAALAEVAADDGSVRFLSDLPPTRVEEGSPFGDDLGMTWPHRVDRCVSGGPLSVGGSRHTRGLGVHAPSRLYWDLDGTYAELRGLCALDDEVRELGGSVEFVVLLDGEPAWTSGVRRGGDPLLEIPTLDLSGAGELALVVDPAEDLFVFDRANWLRMVLVR